MSRVTNPTRNTHAESEMLGKQLHRFQSPRDEQTRRESCSLNGDELRVWFSSKVLVSIDLSFGCHVVITQLDMVLALKLTFQTAPEGNWKPRRKSSGKVKLIIASFSPLIFLGSKRKVELSIAPATQVTLKSEESKTLDRDKITCRGGGDFSPLPQPEKLSCSLEQKP